MLNTNLLSFKYFCNFSPLLKLFVLFYLFLHFSKTKHSLINKDKKMLKEFFSHFLFKNLEKSLEKKNLNFPVYD